MRPRSAAYPFCVLAAALALATSARAEVAPTCFPANNAKHVNPDTHLFPTFSGPPTLGKSGQIRIYEERSPVTLSSAIWHEDRDKVRLALSRSGKRITARARLGWPSVRC